MMGLGPREPQQPAMQPAMGQEMAQGGAPQMAPAPAAPAQPGNRLAEFEAFITSNDFGFLKPAQQKFVMDEYQRLQDAANPDPMRDLQIQKTQIEIDRMRNPQSDPMKEVQLEREKLELEQLKNPAAKPNIQVFKIGKQEIPVDMNNPPDWAKEYMQTGKLPEGMAAPGGAAGAAIDDPLKISKDYQSQDGFERTKMVAPTIASMYRSLNDPSAMADLDFVYGLAKILDPTSVVRESEAGMVIDSQGIGPALLGQLNKIATGQQAMLPDIRKKLFEVAYRRAQELQGQAKGEREFFSNMAVENDINPDTYLQQVPGLPKWQDQSMKMPQGGSPAPAPIPNPPAIPAPPGVDPRDWEMLSDEERALWLN
jgi:hypothetical protein